MQKKFEKFLRGFLIFVIGFLLVETVVHFSDSKLTDVMTQWPQPAITYATIMDHFFAAFALLIAMLLIVAQANPRKYKPLFQVTAVWAAFYGAYLMYLALTIPLDEIFRPFPSLALWIPMYNFWIFGEGIFTLSYAVLVYFWQKNVKE